MDWTLTEMDGEGNSKSHPAMVEVEEVYVDLIPREWGVGDSNYPEKWVFTVTQDLETIIGYSPYENTDGIFPNFTLIEGAVDDPRLNLVDLTA
mgnify:CR=1 FL=1